MVTESATRRGASTKSMPTAMTWPGHPPAAGSMSTASQLPPVSCANRIHPGRSTERRTLFAGSASSTGLRCGSYFQAREISAHSSSSSPTSSTGIQGCRSNTGVVRVSSPLATR